MTWNRTPLLVDTCGPDSIQVRNLDKQATPLEDPAVAAIRPQIPSLGRPLQPHLRPNPKFPLIGL